MRECLFEHLWSGCSPTDELVLIRNPSGMWWRMPGGGLANIRDHAHIWTCRAALDAIRGHSEDRRDGIMLEFIGNEPEPAFTPPPTTAPTEQQVAELAAIIEGGNEPIRLTKDQCREHLDELVRKQCYCWDTREGYFKEPLGQGYTRNKEEAYRCSVSVGIGHNSALETMIELVDQEIAARIAAEKFNVKTLLGLSIVEMLKMAPLNLTARAKVMAVVGVMPPMELDAWEKIREWVATTYQPKSPAKTKSPPVPEQIFEVPVLFSDTETGSCNYSVSRSARDAFQINSELIRGIVIENGISSIGSLIERLGRYISEEAWVQLEPDMDTGDDHEYTDYEYRDTEGGSVDLPNGINQAQLTSWLRSTQSAETLALLGILPEPPF